MTSVETGLQRGADTTTAPAAVLPTLVRVSVLGGNTQLDLALPAAVPIASLMGDLVGLIDSRNLSHRQASDADSESDEPSEYVRWTLARIGQAPLAVEFSLAESGVRDGDLLMITTQGDGTAPALFDDVVDAVARLTEARYSNWSPSAARVLGYVAAIVGALVAAVCLGGVRRHDPALWPAIPAGIVAMGLLVASAIVARHYLDTHTATVLAASAFPTSFIAGMLSIPGSFASAHLSVAFAAVLLTAVISYRLTAVGPILHSAAITTAVLGGATALAVLLVNAIAPHVEAVAATVGLLALAIAPRLTIVLAKLPLPPVPTAGSTLADDLEPGPTIAGIGAIGAMALPQADALERRSYLANSYLTGIIVGATTATLVLTILAAGPWSGVDVKSYALALLIAAVLCLRGRSHGDLAQACTLIAGGCVIVAVLVGALAWGDGRVPLVGFVGAALLMAVALILGVVAAVHNFSPVLRRSAELVEYALVVTIVPLLLWILDVYQTARDL